MWVGSETQTGWSCAQLARWVTVDGGLQWAGCVLERICVRAQAGTYANAIGSRSCANCPLGKHQDQAAQTECLACTPGFFVNAEAQVRFVGPYLLSSGRGGGERRGAFAILVAAV